jgi:hypothetical protein
MKGGSACSSAGTFSIANPQKSSTKYRPHFSAEYLPADTIGRVIGLGAALRAPMRCRNSGIDSCKPQPLTARTIPAWDVRSSEMPILCISVVIIHCRAKSSLENTRSSLVNRAIVVSRGLVFYDFAKRPTIAPPHPGTRMTEPC